MAKHHGMHHGKHLESPEGGENALPHPKHEKIGGHHGSDRKLASPEASPAGLNHHSPTPDIGHRKNKLFNHKPNHRGV
jgi:hypothetical protein